MTGETAPMNAALRPVTGRRRRLAALAVLIVTLVCAACTTPGRGIDDGGNDFVWPVEGPIVSAYGPKPGKRYNDGVNIAAPAGTPIRAAADGIVIYTGNELRGFGNLILLRHAADWTSAYAHAQQVRVKRNQRVAKGAILALVGRTGAVACPQLHFELRRSAKAIDPEAVLANRPRSMLAGAGVQGETGCPADGAALPGS